MVEYFLGCYSIKENIDESILKATLLALEQSEMNFFPAKMWVSKGKQQVFNSAKEFDRKLVPKEFFIRNQDAHISFNSKSGFEFIIDESSEPKIGPASFQIQFTDEMFQKNVFSLGSILDLFKSLRAIFKQDYGFLWDQEHYLRSYYDDIWLEIDKCCVLFSLFWVNYYSLEWVENIGIGRLERLSKEVPFFEWQKDGGVLFAIQEEPYDESNEKHRKNLMRLEEIFGLKELHAKYPYLGVGLILALSR